jgi:hypothetical protein
LAALELSKTRRAASAKSWLVATSAPGEEKVDLHPLWRTPQQARYDPSGGEGWQ